MGLGTTQIYNDLNIVQCSKSSIMHIWPQIFSIFLNDGVLNLYLSDALPCYEPFRYRG